MNQLPPPSQAIPTSQHHSSRVRVRTRVRSRVLQVVRFFDIMDEAKVSIGLSSVHVKSGDPTI